MGLAVGAALASKMDGNGAVSIIFGDGAANQGVLMEAMNICSLWNLPMIFMCENNQYSEFTHTSEVTSGKIVDRAEPFGIPKYEVDGNNAVDVWQAAYQAVQRGEMMRAHHLLKRIHTGNVGMLNLNTHFCHELTEIRARLSYGKQMTKTRY